MIAVCWWIIVCHVMPHWPIGVQDLNNRQLKVVESYIYWHYQVDKCMLAMMYLLSWMLQWSTAAGIDIGSDVISYYYVVKKLPFKLLLGLLTIKLDNNNIGLVTHYFRGRLVHTRLKSYFHTPRSCVNIVSLSRQEFRNKYIRSPLPFLCISCYWFAELNIQW